MVDSAYKIKGVEENDQLLYIGGIFRFFGNSEWYVQVRFSKSKKKAVLASLIPDLCVGRYYNVTDIFDTQAKSKKIIIKWSDVKARANGKTLGLNPINGLNRNEKYFLLQKKNAWLAIPQLELARSLFLQNNKMFGYALSPVALNIDFRRANVSQSNLMIEVMDSVQLSKGQFEKCFNATQLAYTLCDSSALSSFISIHENFRLKQNTSKVDGCKVTWWNFCFNLPNLKKVKMELLLSEHISTYQGQNLYIANEIKSIIGIPHNLPVEIEFISQKWAKVSVSQSTLNEEKLEVAGEFIIDDEQGASSFSPTKIISSNGIGTFSLSPNRSARTKSSKGKVRVINESSEAEASGSELISTDLPTLLGSASAAIFVATTKDDNGDDKNIFDNFRSMLKKLCEESGLSLTELRIQKLRKIGRFKSHMKKDGTGIRKAAVAHLTNPSVNFETITLIEIDQSDFPNTGSKKNISTLVFKFTHLDDARAKVETILDELIIQSIAWPRDFFKQNKISTQFVNHPKNYRIEKADIDVIDRWVVNTQKKIEQL
ncbi:Tn7-like element transposition protein TnsE [Pseudocolwellia sp. AS88]|uniref:Tn7-like element transposition protein TnsE n=1 Tax=Pseudocolwellia sp. AS88 TaxID=3063958 RepID=UPI0026F157AE|nr:Tn7-like element transposition protein TnsE [Pseudocolwellia sp. AS88]MDO7085155.1 Tn7-like element transposition protein TnsE [Pseudocolwellia sp. AS88]